MNREFLLEAVLGIAFALLLAALAVHRSTRPAGRGPLRRAGMVAVILYGVLGGTALVQSGVTWVGVLGLLVLVCLPVLGMFGAARLRPAIEVATNAWARRLVAVGLAAAMLVVAGQTLSMLALVDPRTVVVVLAGGSVLLLTGRGPTAAGRVGSLAIWLLFVPILVALALGGFLGDVGQVFRPIIEVPAPSVWHLTALAVAFLIIGAADPGLALSRAAGGWPPARVLRDSLVMIAALFFGLLMFLGGAVVAPSMQFFVVPANINLVPGLAGALVLVLTVILLALVTMPLSGLLLARAPGDPTPAEPAGGPTGPIDARTTTEPLGEARLVVLGGGLAAVVALVVPGLPWIVVGTSLAAAVAATARSARGVQVGLAAGAVGLAALAFSDGSPYGWGSALVALVVAGVAAVPAPADTGPSDPGLTPRSAQG